MRKSKFRISPFFLLVWTVLLIFNKSDFVFPVFFSAAVHEAAHITAFLLFGAEIESVMLQPFGASAKLMSASCLTCRQEVFAALAGIAANIVFAAVICALPSYMLTAGRSYYLTCNILLAAINIIPIEPLDGGRALYFILLMRFPPDKCDKLSKIISLILIVPLFILSVKLLIQSGYNFSLLLIVIYLLCYILFKK